MKLKAKNITNTGTYMHLETEIVIDTEDYEATRKLLRELHENFFKLHEQPKPTKVEEATNQSLRIFKRADDNREERRLNAENAISAEIEDEVGRKITD